MKNSFLFKRGEYYHLEYFDELENRIKRTSTGCKKKSDAMRFVSKFSTNQKPKTKYISLREFFNLYNEHVKTNLSAKYYRDVEFTGRKLIEFCGDIALIKLNSLLLDNFITNETVKSKHVAVKHYANLRGAFNKAMAWGYIDTNPIQKIKASKPPKNNPLFVNEDELEIILKKEDNSTLKNLFQFAFHTGMRLGEIVNIKWNAVDLQEKIIKVQNTDSFTTKGKQERVIPINEKLLSILLFQLPKIMSIEKDIYVFNKAGIRYNEDFISKRFKKALRKTDLNSKLHFHDLRHSFASNLAMKGVPLYTIMELLGHKEIKTTQIYSHLKVENLRDAVKVLEC